MYATNGSVARVDLEVPLGDAGWQTSISTSLNGGSVTSGALDSSAGRGYFGTAYGCVVRFLLQQLSQTFAMSNVLCGLGSDPLTSAAVDPANAFLYLGSSAASDATATTGATLYKVRLSDFTLVASLALHSAGNTGAMSATTGYADWILRSIAIPTGETAFISVDTGTDSATSPAALVAVYLGGSYSNSMRRLSTFRTQAGIAEGRLTGAILAGHDPSGYFKAYYTAWSDPARIIRIFLYTPALTSVAPSDGPFAGGNAVTYGGTGMLPSVAGHTATLGTGAVTALSIASFTSISGTLPTSGFAAGRPTFTLTSPAFGSVTSSLYTVNPAATIASAVPNNGPYARNVTVTITGTNFLLQDPTLHLSLVLTTNPTTVVSTLSTTIVSTTTLRSVLRGSAAAAGAYDLELTSPRFGTATLASGYTVNPPATISYSVPADGPWSGGNQITIFGTNFLTPDTSIAASVGAVAASGVAPLNATAFVLTVPASNATFVSLAPGTYNVSAASDRFGDAFADAVYTVNPPATVTAVSPTDGPYNGNRVVTVFGTNFFAVDPGIVAAFGAAYTTTTVTLVNSTQLEFLAPTMAMAAGLYDVVLTSPRFGVANGSQLFTVNPQAFVDYTIPADWSYNGGVSLTIFGRNFFEAEAGVAVTVGGASCTSVVVLNATAINVTLPVPIPYAVSNPPMVVESYRFGTANSTYFRVNPPMNVTSVTPTNGPLRGNTTVTISGTGFPLDDPTVVLSLGGAPWTNFTISSSTQILATIPSYPLPAGTYAVGITAERYGSATLAGGYTLNPAATIASVYPAEGGDGGGNFVTLTGTNFFAGEAGLYATFNSLVTASVTALSTTRLLVVTPRGADVGYPLITVYSARFGEATTSSYRVFPEPYISYSVPSDGPFVGGNRITLFGQNFVANETATEVDITIFTVGSPSVFRPPSFAVTSNTTIELTVPGVSLGAGLQNVTVDSIRFGFIWATVYTVNPQPTVASTSPSNLPSAECHGMAVTIIGTNFIVNDTVTARLGSVTLENVTVVSGTSLGGVLPATGAFPVGGVTVTISSTRTGSATRANGFTFNPPATIGLIRPTSAPFASSTATVTILGTGFFTVDPGINATVGATYPPASNIQLFTTTRIQLVVSPASLGVGQHPIRLLSPRFGTALSPTNFTVNPPGAIASVIPNSRPVSGGYSVTILGENLGGGDVSFVSLAGVPAVAITFQNSTCVEVTTGAGPALISGGPVALLSPTFGNTTQDGLFSLTCETDTICIAEPKTGPAAGGTTVTIYGDNVSDGAAGDVTAASVTFGSVAAASLVSFSATQVVVTTAASTTTTGPVDVTVVSLSKGSKTLARGFTYRPLLGKPRAVGTMDARESQMSLVWITPGTPYADPPTSYRLKLYLVRSGALLSNTVYDWWGEAANTTLTGLIRGFEYLVEVTAINADGEGPLPASKQFKTEDYGGIDGALRRVRRLHERMGWAAGTGEAGTLGLQTTAGRGGDAVPKFRSAPAGPEQTVSVCARGSLEDPLLDPPLIHGARVWLRDLFFANSRGIAFLALSPEDLRVVGAGSYDVTDEAGEQAAENAASLAIELTGKWDGFFVVVGTRDSCYAPDVRARQRASAALQWLGGDPERIEAALSSPDGSYALVGWGGYGPRDGRDAVTSSRMRDPDGSGMAAVGSAEACAVLRLREDEAGNWRYKMVFDGR